MDITKKPDVTCIEWFHGYGGNALGLKRAIPGLRSIAVCERDAFVVANMVSKMEAGLLDAVPIWTDVTDFPCEPFGYQQLDLFVASYPCQGFSNAGKRLGAADHRHLWPYCRKFVRAVRPRFVWLENVEGHVSLGLSTVLADLEEDGYTAAWGIFSASEVGAPHQRKRVFILAYDKSMQRDGGDDNTRVVLQLQEVPELGNCGGEDELALRDSIGRSHGELEKQSAERGEYAPRDTPTSGGEDVAHHHHQGLQGLRERGGQTGREVADGHAGGDSQVWPSRPGQPQYAWEPPRVVEGPNIRPGKSWDRFSVGNPTEPRPSHEFSTGRRNATAGLVGEPPNGENGANIQSLGQTQSPLGGNANGLTPRVDLSRLSGLSDSELDEIYDWMVKGTNRTDELRLCGNGVVTQTAEKAFRVLYDELTRFAGTGFTV